VHCCSFDWRASPGAGSQPPLDIVGAHLFARRLATIHAMPCRGEFARALFLPAPRVAEHDSAVELAVQRCASQCGFALPMSLIQNSPPYATDEALKDN
jgi:hypothetical protein